MKISDYVADFIAAQGIKTVFAIGGGASLHLIHSIAERGDTNLVYPHHEQAAGFAADGYARALNGLGCAIATSGPGATNLITAINGAWCDSIPVLFITGQTAAWRYKQYPGVRQTGFQETDILGMVRGITKYASTVTKAGDVAGALHSAVHYAISGRPGPVLVDICDDVQRQDTDALTMMVSPSSWPVGDGIARVLPELAKSRRPVLVLGAGTASAIDAALAFAERWMLPVAPTWGALDLVAGHPLNIGAWGTHGRPGANAAVQNADLVLTVGSRLDTHMTGAALKDFAPHARKIVVDVDQGEAMARGADIAIQASAAAFFGRLDGFAATEEAASLLGQWPPLAGRKAWLARIERWRRAEPEARRDWPQGRTDPYGFMDALSAALPDGAMVYADTGHTLAWACQRLELARGQRLISDWNNTAMGWALPAAIGGAFACPERPIICLVGDGALMMNLQELQTVVGYKLPIKILCLNNKGYGMNRQTQDQWFAADYQSSGSASGLTFPDFTRIGRAFGIDTRPMPPWITENGRNDLAEYLRESGPLLLDVAIDPAARLVHYVGYGQPLAQLDDEAMEAAQ